MHQTLSLILEAKKRSIKLLKKSEREIYSLVDKASRTVSLSKAITSHKGISIISELKQASPSKGLLRQDFNIPDILAIYKKMGACAVSVVTEEEFFLGKLKYIKDVKSQTKLPVLRKDFILDEIQVYHSRALGSDAILLIAKLLPIEKLQRLYNLSKNLGMDVIIEVHSLRELKEVIKFSPEIIGINNRDLDTFTVDLKTTDRLAPLVPNNILVVSESGIDSLKDVLLLKGAEIDAILVGESFMRAGNISEKFKEFQIGCQG